MGNSSSYIVRVYRSEKGNPRLLVGVVEEVGVEGKRAFQTYDELWDILNPRLHKRRQPPERKPKSGEKKGTEEELMKWPCLKIP
jgi:hypothetical protein